MPEPLRARTVHIEDPRQVIHDDVGEDIHAIEIWGTMVLVGIYIRPETVFAVAPSIIASAKTMEEDRFQSKVGLVLKTGPLCFIDNERDYPMRLFGNLKVARNDWVAYRASDGFKVIVGDRECRLIADTCIRAKLDHPDAIF